MGDAIENVVRLDSAQAALKRHFLGWQCRIRQHAMRSGGGRPSAGMRPSVSMADGNEPLADIVVLIREADSHDTTAKFRHMVRKTHDPRERLDGAVRELSAAYFQHPDDFSDEMTALFAPDSALGAALVKAGRCMLSFDQYSQRYRIPCDVRTLTAREPGWQATFWHNSLFNPNIPGDACILGFTPDWAAAAADPPPPAR